MTQDEVRRKPRHRRRATAAAGPPQPPVTAPVVATPVVAAPTPEPDTKPKQAAKPRNQSRTPVRGQRRDGGERAMRDLAGTGSSQLGVSRAMRARDVNRPTDADLAEAEARVQVVRRNWQPQ